MTGLRKDLPKRAWLRIYRVTGLLTAISVAISVICTNLFMEIFSAGINVHHPIGIFGALKWTQVGERPANEDASIKTKPMALLDASVGREVAH